MLHGLTENHERSLLASVQYAARLIRNCDDVLAGSSGSDPLSRYTKALSAPQEKIDETRMAMDHWFKAVETDAVLNANVEQNLPHLARQPQKQSFGRRPTPTGIPISTHIHITTSST